MLLEIVRLRGRCAVYGLIRDQVEAEGALAFTNSARTAFLPSIPTRCVGIADTPSFPVIIGGTAW